MFGSSGRSTSLTGRSPCSSRVSACYEAVVRSDGRQRGDRAAACSRPYRKLSTRCGCNLRLSKCRTPGVGCAGSSASMTSIDASSFWPLRLIPGDDLRRALEEAVHARGLSAAFVVAGMGSLRQTRLRLACSPTTEDIDGDVELLPCLTPSPSKARTCIRPWPTPRGACGAVTLPMAASCVRLPKCCWRRSPSGTSAVYSTLPRAGRS